MLLLRILRIAHGGLQRRRRQRGGRTRAPHAGLVRRRIAAAGAAAAGSVLVRARRAQRPIQQIAAEPILAVDGARGANGRRSMQFALRHERFRLLTLPLLRRTPSDATCIARSVGAARVIIVALAVIGTLVGARASALRVAALGSVRVR